MFGRHPRKPVILNAWFQLWNMEPDLCWFGEQYLVFCWSSTLNGRITASDYVDILGSQVHQMVQVLFPNNDAVFQDDDSPYTPPKVFSLGLRSVKMHFNISLASTFTQRKYWITLVSFREQGEKQIPSIISQATRRRYKMCYSQWWPSFILIKKYVSFTALSIIFVHLLCMLPSCIPWGDKIYYVEMYLCK